MREKTTRKEWQFEKFMQAANQGLFSINMSLYKGEVKYWSTRGLIVKGPKRGYVTPRNHTVSWDFPQLMDYPEVVDYVYNSGMMPENFTDGQKLFLIAKKVREKGN